MNRPLRSLWLEMLRSGAFAQTRGRLQRTADQVVHSPQIGVATPPAGYCCLGVLCEAASQAGLVPDLERWPDNGALKGVSLMSQGLLALEDSLGDPTKLAGAPGSGRQVSLHLTHMNDNNRATFNEIADWIEKYVPVDDATSFKV